MRKINAAGLAHIKKWEGCRLDAYQDVAGIWTIGYGHTTAAGPPTVNPGLRITQAQADEILRDDLGQFEVAVEQAVKVKLTDNQFAVLISFAFNVGIGAFHKSTLLRKLNKGDYDGVPMELGKWVNAGGKPVAGLANRRAAEAGLWAKDAFVASNTAPAEPAKVNPVFNAEMATGVGVPVATAAFGAAAYPGPLQIANAIVVVIAAVVAAVFIINRIRERNP